MSTVDLINKRFTNVLDELKYRKLIKNDADLAKKLSIAPQNLYKIKAGTANVTIQILVDLFNNYNINPSFFFTDKTPMFMGEVKHYDADGGEVLVLREEKIKGYDQEVENLKEHLNEYKLLVSLLKEKINLKDE